MCRWIFVLFLALTSVAFAETVVIEKNLVIQMFVAGYVNGFKKYDTTVNGYDDSVSIGIYVPSESQSKEAAEELAKKFRNQVPKLLGRVPLGADIKVTVTVY